jgi:transforming growth factor-beta-induced protein
MNRTIRRSIAALAGLSLLATACGDDGDDSTDDTTAETAAPAEESADSMAEDEAMAEDSMVEDEMSEDSMAEDAMAEEGTIVDVAVASGEFPTLIAAVEAAGLGETLSGEGPFTVFAPTEEAFAAALEALDMTAEELLADTELLTSVLTYHVLPDEVLAETVVTLDGESVATVNGADIMISVDGDTVMINDEATVVQTDITASNGVIHVIDTVLLPPS